MARAWRADARTSSSTALRARPWATRWVSPERRDGGRAGGRRRHVRLARTARVRPRTRRLTGSHVSVTLATTDERGRIARVFASSRACDAPIRGHRGGTGEVASRHDQETVGRGTAALAVAAAGCGGDESSSASPTEEWAGLLHRDHDVEGLAHERHGAVQQPVVAHVGGAHRRRERCQELDRHVRRRVESAGPPETESGRRSSPRSTSCRIPSRARPRRSRARRRACRGWRTCRAPSPRSRHRSRR